MLTNSHSTLFPHLTVNNKFSHRTDLDRPSAANEPAVISHVVKFAILLLSILLFTGCTSDIGYDASAVANYTEQDFYGSWYTDLPNGERWELTLETNGRFQSRPIRNSHRPPCSGTWRVNNGAIHWRYDQGDLRGETNPIIKKSSDKFMLQERMGMQSLYYRSYA